MKFQTTISMIALFAAVLATTGYSEQRDSKAVSVARAHIEAWSNHDYNAAKSLLSADVRVTATTTAPTMSATNLVGVDSYMEGLKKFADSVKAGSARILHTSGDDKNALIVVEVRAMFGPQAPEITLTAARLYRLDEKDHIESEQVIFYIETH